MGIGTFYSWENRNLFTLTWWMTVSFEFHVVSQCGDYLEPSCSHRCRSRISTSSESVLLLPTLFKVAYVVNSHFQFLIITKHK